MIRSSPVGEVKTSEPSHVRDLLDCGATNSDDSDRMSSLRTMLASFGLALSAVRIFAADSAGLDVPAGLVLAESERVYIAKIEHRGLTLNQKAFPVITAAIRA